MARLKRRLSGETSALNPAASPPKQKLQAVRDILIALERALKSAHLYPAGSPIPGELRLAFDERLREHLREEGSLPLTIVCDEIYLGDDLVYEAGRDERNFAFALFDGGIKELCFHEGVDDAEAEGLIAALRQGIDSDLESVAALLWQRNLPHVSFVTVDLVGDDPGLSHDESEVTERASAVRDRLRDRVVLLEQVVDMRRRGARGEGGDGAPAAAGEAEAEASPFALDPASTEALQGRVEALDAAPLLTEAFDLLRALIQAETAAEPSARLVGMLRHLLQPLAQGGDLGRVVRAIAEVRTALDEGSPPPALRAAYEGVLEESHGPELAKAVASRLRGEDAGLVLAYVKALGRDSVKVASALLGKSGFDPEIVAAIGEAQGASLGHLREHLIGEDEVAAWVAVRLLAEHLGERAIPDLDRAADHRSARVRGEAVAALAKLPGPRSRGRALEAACDREPAVRKRALDALIAFRSGPEVELLTPLEVLVGDASFRERSPDERRALLTLVALADPARGAGILEAALRRFHLFRRREAEEHKLLVVEALARAGTREAREALERARQTAGAAVGRACQEALARFRAAR